MPSEIAQDGESVPIPDGDKLLQELVCTPPEPPQIPDGVKVIAALRNLLQQERDRHGETISAHLKSLLDRNTERSKREAAEAALSSEHMRGWNAAIDGAARFVEALETMPYKTPIPEDLKRAIPLFAQAIRALCLRKPDTQQGGEK